MRTKLHARGLVEVVVFTFVLCGFAWPRAGNRLPLEQSIRRVVRCRGKLDSRRPARRLRSAGFDLANTYTVTFQTAKTNNYCSIGGGDVTFNLGGNTYSLDHAFIGYIDGQIGKLTLTQGTIEAPTDVGNSAADIGFLTVSTGAVLNSSYLIVGFGGTGTLTVQNGGNIN